MIVKQVDVRANIKQYFELACSGEPIIVPRKDNKNIVIISEAEYNRLQQQTRLSAYASSLLSHSERSTTQVPATTDIRADNLNKLELIHNLKDGWNGNGAPAFSESLIEKVRELITALYIQPEVFPTALSSIQFEIDNSRRDHMEIEISESDSAEIFIVTYDGRESFETIPSASDDINRKVSAFYG